MPDVSNEDLMRLIQQIMKKVDTIEEKLDSLLQSKEKYSQLEDTGDLEDFDYGFTYTPISNDLELACISNRIKKDEEYKKNLRHHMKVIDNLRLEDLFTEEFLFNCNSTGKNGRKKLQGLVPFHEIYVYLKRKTGLTYEGALKTAFKELARVKHRMHERKSYKRRSGIQSTKEIETDEEIEYLEEEEDEDIETTQNFESDDDSMDTINFSEPGEIYIKENPVISDQDEDDDDFTPIKNEQELIRITKKINSNPLYLKNLRLHVVEESQDGNCSLLQIFSVSFLHGCNFSGSFGRRKLTDLVPYKAVYFYLRKHLGQSLKEIELDASNEIKRIKNRVYQCKRRQKVLKNKNIS